MSGGWLVVVLGSSLGMSAFVLAGEAPSDYAAEIEKWRSERLERLRSETGWLTLVGLHWLEPGETRFGSDPELPIVLEAPGIPQWAGTFRLEAEAVTVVPAPGASLTVRDEPLTVPRRLADDGEGDPDVVQVGRLNLNVIRRGERFGVRVKDPESPTRTGFTGIEHYPVDPAYRIVAKLERFAEPRKLDIPTAVGTVEQLLAPGTVKFTVAGEVAALLPLVSEPDEKELWFIFSDATSGKETYGFRYLYGTLAEDGTVEVDFNRAYNPPCAFTPHATCALPPKENRLAPLRIAAGEKIYGKH